MAKAKPARRIPRYCLHKPSGQARVIIKGRHCYLGPYGSTESWEKYHRLLAEQTGLAVSPASPTPDHPLTIAELIDNYWEHVLQHYVKDGQLTGEHNNIRAALRPVLKLYGDTPAADFGPKALKAARQAMIEADISRGVINANASKVRRMFASQLPANDS